MRINPEATATSGDPNLVFWTNIPTGASPPEPPGPLNRWQCWLWGREHWVTDRLGNVLSDVRYWLWRLSR